MQRTFTQVFVLEEKPGKQWCLVATLGLRAGWVPCNHLGNHRVAELPMLKSLDVATRKHATGTITEAEFQRIAAVFAKASERGNSPPPG